MVERHLTRIGKYEVECVIGEGAMGVVYRAMDPLINRRVAIKVMTEAVAQDAALRERFLREAQAAGSLQHPNVVTIYDFGEVDDHLFIAMEYVEGNDLADLLDKKVPIPLTDALDLIIGLLHGLAFAHKRGIVHRDIKPANVRVDTEGRARLMDFGVAHLASSEMTSTGILLGTPAYMAPEQITGGSVTPETDIFSVGAVLYELLAGRRPFVGDTLQALMYSILNKTPESLETLVSKMPRGLNEIVMRSLNKEPSQRYHSAVVMANDLAAIRTSLDPEGKRTSLSLRTAIDTALAQEHTFRSRRKLEWRAATFAAGVLLVAVVIIGGRMLLTRNSGVAPVPTPTVTPQSATQQPAPVSVSTAAAPPSALSSPAQQPTSAAGPRIAQTKTASTRESSKTTAAQPTAPPAARVDTRVPDSAPPPVVAAPHVAAAPERTPSVTQSSTPTPVVTPPASAPATALRENVAEQVNAVVAAYAHAIESLDTGELRRVYPAITAEQRHAFDDFFGSVRSLKASLSVSGLQVDGGSADAQVAGAFDYVTTSGATEHRPVRFVATLHRDRGAWTLAAVH